MDEQTIFTEALEQPQELRAKFIQEACGRNQERVARIQHLLNMHEQPSELGPFPGLVNLARKLVPDDLIGPYQLLEQIGEGGMGIVFRALQREPVRREVAIKIIKPGMDTKQVLGRFEGERQALALMDHANIARVFDAGATKEGRPYFVMELARGVPVTEYCDNERLRTKERLTLFLTICKAVQHAHQKGIIHRDLKPSNILVTLNNGEPTIKMIDFGVAKATTLRLTEQTVYTQLGQVIGTPTYMSPEQAEITGLDVDTRSDVYSLGVLLYELLTGSTPFEPDRLKQASYDEMRRIIREEEPPKPSSRIGTIDEKVTSIFEQRRTNSRRLIQTLSGELDWIVLKAIDKSRSRRYQTASELAEDVDRYLNDRPVEACPPSLSYSVRKFVSKHRRSVAVAATLVISLVSATIYSIGAGQREAEARRQADDSRQAVLSALDRATENERLAQVALYESHLAHAQAAQLSRRMGQRTVSLEAIQEASKLARRLNLGEEAIYELRTRAISAMSLIDVDQEQVWPRPQGRWRDAMADSNSNEFATIGPNETIILIRKGDDRGILQRLSLPDGQKVLGGFLFSPNGKYLAARCRIGEQLDHACVWDLDTSKPILEIPVARPWDPNLRWIHLPYDFSTDSKLLAVCRRKQVDLISLPDGEKINTIDPSTLANTVRFSNGGEYLAIGTVDSLQVFEYATERETPWKVFPVSKPVNTMAWSTDGLLAASLFRGERIPVWQADSGALRFELQGFGGIVNNIAFHPRLKLLVTHGTDAVSRLWDTDNGRLILDFPSSPTHFTRDELGIASRAGRLKLCLPERSVLQATASPSNAGAWKSDYCFHPNRRLIVGSNGASSVVIDANTRHVLLERELPFYGYQFSAAGDALFCQEESGPIWRFPVSIERRSEEIVMSIGPEKEKVEPMSIPPSWEHEGSLTQSQANRFFVMPGRETQVWILDHFTGRVYEFDTGREERAYADVSSDGQYVAAGFHSGGLMIWNAFSGELLKTLPDSGSQSRPTFRPNGHLLALAESSRCRFLKRLDGEGREWEFVHSWENDKPMKRRRRALPVAFSPDGGLVALVTRGSNQRALDLLDSDSFERLATLRGSGTAQLWNATLSPCSDYMLAWGSFEPAFQLWDVFSIRQQLKKLGLNWAGGSPHAPLDDQETVNPMRIVWAADP